ncbi:MAG: excinuclease ABC subunit UvrC [Chitinophagaceae bacterium]|nr:excinuclease ABC subunit UvrC [Chitinophagaceae bacterium]
MTQEDFQSMQANIPTDPGIYKYFDAGRQLLYVGKAKNIRKRVSSYFTRSQQTRKTAELVRRIAHIEFTIVHSEQDAFLLENSLIKEFRPKYNIDLKDDKTYPYIVIRNEPFPRVYLTRRRIQDGSEYLGPFTSAGKVRELMQFIRQHIPIRTCKLNLSEQNIRQQKFKVCLEFHLGNCKGPCAGLQTASDYMEGLQRMRYMLKGNLGPVLQQYRKDMKSYAESMAFEKAAQVKKKIEHLEQYQSSSPIINPRLGDLDVFNLAEDGEDAFVNYLMVRNGTITDTRTLAITRKLDESAEEVMALTIAHFRETFQSDAPEMVLPFVIEYPDPGIKVTVPKGGDKKKLLELSAINVNYFRTELQKRKRLHLGVEKDPLERIAQLQEDLSLQELPVHIECFDNSHFQGSFPVSAMVCFRDGMPSKQDYRHYNVKTVEGINDFATMKEVVHRRYKKLLDTGAGLPQLVIIDGGKGQLGAALESIEELGLIGRMTLIGLAKNEEEVFFAGDKESLKLPYNGSSLMLIRHIRDEVHRFGISFHRKKRSSGTFRNELEQIQGIGRQTADQLLQHFRSVKKVAAASETELAELIGGAKARMVFKHFREQ